MYKSLLPGHATQKPQYFVLRTEAEGTYKVAVKAIDKAAAKGLLHKNNAAHKKSALTLKLNNIG